METLTASLLLAWLASGPSAFAARPAHVQAPPPKILNVVRQKLKAGTSHSYESLETAIVAAYEQSHVPLFWTDERTTIPYDAWVLAILAFVWLTPPDWLGDPMASGPGLIGLLTSRF